MLFLMCIVIGKWFNMRIIAWPSLMSSYSVADIHQKISHRLCQEGIFRHVNLFVNSNLNASCFVLSSWIVNINGKWSYLASWPIFIFAPPLGWKIQRLYSLTRFSFSLGKLNFRRNWIEIISASLPFECDVELFYLNLFIEMPRN